MDTPYRRITLNKHDIISRDIVDQLQANYQWINDNTPRGRLLRGTKNPIEDMLVVVCGREKISRDKKRDTQKVTVKFPGNAFAPGCRPIVTTGVVADFQRQIFCVVHGPKGVNFPNENGFEITVNIAADKNKDDKIKKDFWVHWQAFGYRRER